MLLFYKIVQFRVFRAPWYQIKKNFLFPCSVIQKNPGKYYKLCRHKNFDAFAKQAKITKLHNGGLCNLINIAHDARQYLTFLLLFSLRFYFSLVKSSIYKSRNRIPHPGIFLHACNCKNQPASASSTRHLFFQDCVFYLVLVYGQMFP